MNAEWEPWIKNNTSPLVYATWPLLFSLKKSQIICISRYSPKTRSILNIRITIPKYLINIYNRK